MALRDDDAFAGGQSVGFHDDGQTLSPDERGIEGVAREPAVGCRWNAMTGQELFAERFGSLEPCAGLAWPETPQTRCRKLIDDAEHQRCFRSNHGEVDAFAPGKGQQTLDIVCRDGDVTAAGLKRRPGITGRNQHFADSGG